MSKGLVVVASIVPGDNEVALVHYRITCMQETIYVCSLCGTRKLFIILFYSDMHKRGENCIGVD